MSFLVDTCTISELMRSRPEPAVVRWFDGIPAVALHVSVLTLGEIRRGVEGLADGRRRSRLAAWLESELPAWFEDRVLAVDRGIADEWGRLTARAGRPVPAIDSLIAATALHHRLSLVTRNTADFNAFSGLDVVDPWRE